MMILEITPNGSWYHGSNRIFTVLTSGSTITQWKQLAEAFSHKPSILCYDDDGLVEHNGNEPGYLYIIDEPLQIGVDIIPHPNSSMDPNAEFLTTRDLPVRQVAQLPPDPVLTEDRLKDWREKYQSTP